MKKIVLILLAMCSSAIVISMDFPSDEAAKAAKQKAAQEKRAEEMKKREEADLEKFAEEQRRLQESARRYQEQLRSQQIEQLNIPGTYLSVLPHDILPSIVNYKEFAEHLEAQQKLVSDYNSGRLNLKKLSPEQRSQLISGVIHTSPNFEQFKKFVSNFSKRQVESNIEDILVLMNKLLTENPSSNSAFITYLLQNYGSDIVEMQRRIWNPETNKYEGEITAKITKLSISDPNFVRILKLIKSFEDD